MASVTAIIPVYNGEATILEAVQSALALSGECDLEVVVVDDGSRDSTLAILQDYGDRIKVLRQEHLGAAVARNHAIRESRGEYVAFLDADDLWLPGRLKRTVGALESDQAVGLAYCRSGIVDTGTGAFVGERGTEVAPSFEEMLELRFTFQTPAVTMRRRVLEECGGFEEGLSVGEDVLLWLRARERSRFISVPERLAIVRKTWDPREYTKYPPRARLAFARLMHERYGRRAKTIDRLTRDGIAENLLFGALCQIDEGNIRRALGTLIELLRHRPLYLLRRSNLAKIISRRGLRRMSALLKP
jgi:glycosyltransferase involved in cell wall biosynthesis